MDLTSAGFAFDPDWYWRIVEGDGTFGATAARACLIPLGKLAHGRFMLDEIRTDADDRLVHFRIDGTAIVIELNRHLRAVDHAFALVVPRRFELRGVLLPRSILADHSRDPQVIAPTVRPGWRRFASGTSNPQA